MLEKLNVTKTCSWLVLIVIFLLLVLIIFSVKKNGGVKETLSLLKPADNDAKDPDEAPAEEDAGETEEGV